MAARDESPGSRAPLPLGRITGTYGVRGWVRLQSDTDPPEGILEYTPWLLGEAGDQWVERELIEGRRHGSGVVARLAGCTDRDAALRLGGTVVAVSRSKLPALAEDEYYWTDLIGLEVFNRDGRVLGRVERMMATGANDVLVVGGERERLIPYLPGRYVKRVDLAARRLEVDWDADF